MCEFIYFETCLVQLQQWLQDCPQFQTNEVPSTRRLGVENKLEIKSGSSFSSGVQINSLEFEILKARVRRHLRVAGKEMRGNCCSGVQRNALRDEKCPILAREREKEFSTWRGSPGTWRLVARLKALGEATLWVRTWGGLGLSQNMYKAIWKFEWNYILDSVEICNTFWAINMYSHLVEVNKINIQRLVSLTRLQ